MCGKAYDPRFIYAWPNGKIAVMGGEQAAKTLLQIQVAALKSRGQVITPEDEKEMLDKIIAKYSEQTTAYYAASRLWVDAIIDPIETRHVISEGIKAADHAPIEKSMNVGVFQV
jgi:acetyl-CoA carboxylase carboxyltransferase component